MSTIERTAYPRYSNRKKIKPKELSACYTMTSEESSLMRKYARSNVSRLNFAIQLKTFQNLGYFISLQDVPAPVVAHIKRTSKFHHKLKYGYDDTSPTTMYKHRNSIREYLGVTKWSSQNINDRRIHLARKSAIEFAHGISHTMNNISDIINGVIQFLSENNYELPSFNTLNQLVRHTRHAVNNKIFIQVMDQISKNGTQNGFASLLSSSDGSHTLFNELKDQPQRPSIKKFSAFLRHYEWLISLGESWEILSGIAQVKIEQFAAEAKNLSADELKKMNEPRRYTYVASLIYKSQSKAKDALTSMLCRLVSSAHKQSRTKLESRLQDNKTDSCDVAELLKSIAQQSESVKKNSQYGAWVIDKINASGGAAAIAGKCDDVIISHSNEHRVFLSKVLLKNRSLLHKIIKTIDPQSPTGDNKLVNAVKFLVKKYGSTREYYDGDDVDLSFMSTFWKGRVFKKINGKSKLKRKELEACVIDCLSKGLNSGDVYVKGADNYADYRAELMPWDECLKHLDEYCEQIGIPNNPKEMFGQLKSSLIKKANEVDVNYHNINGFKLDDNGTPSLNKYDPKPKNENADKLESLIKSRMPERTLLDILSNVEHYVNWTSECGSAEGQETKLDSPIEKYILTTFAIGTGLGLNQTSRHIRNKVSPRILSRVNAKHFSIKSLNKSITKIINCSNQFSLLNAWGTGESCAVDGTFEDINDNNLFSENHFRYRAKGGVAYHHVADNYIAIFSTFIQCGIWEAIHIIDGLLQNASEIQPKVIHADTQGQSLPVFAFAYLFGIDLMPRIRNWKGLKMYRPEKDSKYTNIDSLFSDAHIDWGLLETHWKDLMQVAISVKFGKVSSVFILNKLNSYNNKNHLYKAFQELGKVQRTLFLLDFISNQDLRQSITDATNKAEAYNDLSSWARFGSKKLVATNDPDEMEKSIKYNQIITNSVMLQDIIDMTNILHELKSEGYKYTIEEVGYLSPYIRGHIKRFGEFVLDLNNKPANIDKIRDTEVF
ncbi:Tn3 family transposase [Francisellaceae bacterium]|nr:Tn3 family transposase [Francisellaceae bacterium]